MSRRAIIVAISSVVVVGLIVGAVVFKPWLLFVDVEVNETLPTISTEAPSEAPTAEATAEPSPDPVPVQLSAGTFVSHAHETSGTVRIIENTDGTRVLTLENLSTSNGPDVHVWLSASDVVEGADGTYLAGSAPYLDLGLIKGNLGNQVYDIPPGADLSQYRSVSLWCVQFSVSFGAAQLA